MTDALRALHPHVGVELTELDVAAPESGAGVLQAAAEHGCVLLRDVAWDAAHLLHFSRQLGTPLPPYRPQYSVPGFPEVVQVGNVVEDAAVVAYLNRGGVEWHTDSPGSSHPAGCSVLYCLKSDIPDGGGETGFVSTVSGHQALPDELKRRCDGIKLVHSFNTFNDQVAAYDGSDVPAQAGDLRDRNTDTIDPLVQRHPRTGACLIYASHAMVKDWVGVPPSEGAALLRDILARVTAPERVYKHVWRPGDLMVFDNRSCLHTPFPYAYDDYPRTQRLLYQVIIGGSL